MQAEILTAFRRNRILLHSYLPGGTFSPVGQRLLRAYLQRNRNLQEQISCAVVALAIKACGAPLLPALFKADETAGQGPQQALAALVRLGDRIGPKVFPKKRLQATL
jgi:hypothetical protein